VVQLPPSEQDEIGAAFRKEAVGRIRREVDALAKCNVPQLVKLASIPATECRIGNNDYVVYSEEFLEGWDLWDLQRNTRDLPSESELKTLLACLLRAIRELWGYGYIHRDIKPSNVMKLADQDRPFVLLDLGIAYSVHETALTYNPGERYPLATYRYMAPERAYPDMRDSLDYRSDLYSAALTVYEYAAKMHPYARDRDDTIQTITRALHDPAKPLKQYRSDLSDGFCDAMAQMLRKKPALRPSNLDRLIVDMEESI
jgi:serine/threonine protein kinase